MREQNHLQRVLSTQRNSKKIYLKFCWQNFSTGKPTGHIENETEFLLGHYANANISKGEKFQYLNERPARRVVERGRKTSACAPRHK